MPFLHIILFGKQTCSQSELQGSFHQLDLKAHSQTSFINATVLCHVWTYALMIHQCCFVLPKEEYAVVGERS